MRGSWTFRIEAQKGDLGAFLCAFQKEVKGKYLDFKILEEMLSLEVAMFQVALTNIPLLTYSRFLMPRPPSFLDLQISTQALR